MVRGKGRVGESLNGLLDTRADEMCKAQRFDAYGGDHPQGWIGSPGLTPEAGPAGPAFISRADYHSPTVGIEVQGSAGGNGGPFCSNSTEILSGERKKAMWPSRGGTLMVIPASTIFWQVA